MSDTVHIKRTNSDLSISEMRSASPDFSNKRHELNSQVAKVGRKPIQSEPKDKRTAQNRAAQRAYRERKERRLKELEDKVANLEDEKLELHNESEFLRYQVEALMGELKKFRNDDITNLLPQKVGHLSSSSPAARTSRDNSDFSSAEKSTPTSSLDSPTGITQSKRNQLNNADHPSSREQPYHANIAVSESSSSVLDNSESSTPANTNNPGLTSVNNDSSISSAASSLSTTNSPKDLHDMGITNDDNVLPLFGHSLRRSSILSNEISNEQFDEKAADFCLKLSEACGTKSCPIPKNISQKGSTHAASSLPFGSTTLGNSNAESPMSPFTALINEHVASTTSQDSPAQAASAVRLEDPYAFLNETPFDPSIAFDINEYEEFMPEDQQSLDQTSKNDPLSNLVVEESLYDPLGMFVSQTTGEKISHPNETNVFSPPAQISEDASKLSGNLVNNKDADDLDADADAVVPSNDGELLKCSAIWDRITQHPRYTEIDIEGLCTELKQKAKCCEKGAVVDSEDVGKLLDGNYLIHDTNNSRVKQGTWFI